MLLLGGLLALAAFAAAPVALALDPPSQTGPQFVASHLDRVFATTNDKLDIDGLDDERVDVDVAVLDSGIKLDHPDLNIAGRTNCTDAGPEFECTAALPGDGDDNEAGHWHGTESAISIAALDNAIGLVGIAPGARVWAVDIHDDDAFPDDPSVEPRRFDLYAAIAGVKWVTARADQIEVAHFLGGCVPDPEALPPLPPPASCVGPAGLVAELTAALEESIDAGVVWSAPGGRIYSVDHYAPQGDVPDMLVSSSVSDSDGKPGWLGPSACGGDADDTKFTNSAWGPQMDVASPACAPSVSSALVTGAAALLASRTNPNDGAGVQDIVGDIVAAGNDGWTDTSPDGVEEPLLDVSDPALFDPVITAGTVTSPGGWDYNLKKRCIKSLSPVLANYYEDTAECGADGKRWTAFVRATDTPSSGGCPGPANQAYPLNAIGSPVTLGWYQHWSDIGPNWTVNLKVDNVYNAPPCMNSDALTHLGVMDHVGAGGGPLPNPRSLITSHEMAYGQWRPNGGATRLVAGANVRWADKIRRVEVDLSSEGFPDSHPDAEVKVVDTPEPGVERVVYDGPAIGRGVPSDYTGTTHWIDWKHLIQRAVDEGWFSDPMTPYAETLSVHVGVQVKGGALANLWTTNFRTAGKQ